MTDYEKARAYSRIDSCDEKERHFSNKEIAKLEMIAYLEGCKEKERELKEKARSLA